MTNNHPTPHDHFFRSMMADTKVAHEFFTTHLPDKIKDIVDLNSLKLRKSSYIGNNLREKIVDLLFHVTFNGAAGYIYLLVEHQSKPEKLMPFRILKYMTAIMEDHLSSTGENTLPIIYPMIFYSGVNHYNYSTDLFDLFENRKLALETLYQPYQLVNISKAPKHQFDQLLWYGVVAQVMRDIHKYRKNITLLLKDVIEKLQKIENLGDFNYITTTVEYCFAVGEVQDEDEFRKVMQHGLTKTGDKIMSYAECLINRGYEKGISQGIDQGISRGISQGIVQGINRGKTEIATKLLQQNLDVNLVANSTGLPLAQILELEKKIKKTA